MDIDVEKDVLLPLFFQIFELPFEVLHDEKGLVFLGGASAHKLCNVGMAPEGLHQLHLALELTHKLLIKLRQRRP